MSHQAQDVAKLFAIVKVRKLHNITGPKYLCVKYLISLIQDFKTEQMERTERKTRGDEL